MTKRNGQVSQQTTEHEINEVARRLLAGLYYNPQHIARCEAERPTFPDRATTVLWDALQSSHEAGSLDTARVDALLQGHDAEPRKLLDEIRQNEIITQIEAAQYGNRGGQLESWARRLREHGAKIQLAVRLGAMADRIRETDASLEEIAAGVIGDTMKITNRSSGSSIAHVSEHIDSALEDVDQWRQGKDPTTIPTGFYELDRQIGGLRVGELTVFASMSGMGKTSWVIQLIRQVAKIEQGKDVKRAVVLFSIEMSARQIIHRAAAQIAKTNLQELRKGTQKSRPGGKYTMDAHKEAIESLRDLPLFIDPDPNPTLDQMYSRCLQVAADYDIALVAVDYDEKVNVDEYREELRVSKIAQGSKILAKKLEAAFVNLSQYNSGPASQMRPGTDSDLRYSQKKKHEASTILHWYWPHYWIAKGECDPDAGDELPKFYDQNATERGRLFASKGRENQPAIVDLEFYPKHTRFVDPEDPEVKARQQGQATPKEEQQTLAEEFGDDPSPDSPF